AFSGTGSGTFTGALANRALEGGITGTINTSTLRICTFTGTLRAAGDTSFLLSLEHRATGGQFGLGALTPTADVPVAITEYLADFRVLFDTDYPAPADVLFTGPA